jgi:purine-nucleoside phosphorylase
MSIHIGAEKGQIAEKVLLAGDPLRARAIAERFLEDVFEYNNVRGMYGYTGNYMGKAVSVQGSGMGIPSISIYAHELINEYDVKTLIRVGTCGSLQENVKIRDIVIAMGACTDSAINHHRFGGMDYAPIADFQLLTKAAELAKLARLRSHVGNILSSDQFYHHDKENWKTWADYGVLAVEMESSALYTLAAQAGVKALTILTVSDHLITKEFASADERQGSFMDMARIALDLNP